VLLRNFGRQADEVILADGNDLQREGVLVVVLSCVCVMRHKLLVVPELARRHPLQGRHRLEA
jgi:hypothetical protein